MAGKTISVSTLDFKGIAENKIRIRIEGETTDTTHFLSLKQAKKLRNSIISELKNNTL